VLHGSAVGILHEGAIEIFFQFRFKHMAWRMTGMKHDLHECNKARSEKIMESICNKR